MTPKLDGIRALLVRCPNWVGDIVMATPALDCLRAGFPRVRIIGVAKRDALDIVRDGPWFDEYMLNEDKTLSGIWNMSRTIKAARPEAAVLFPNSIRSLLPVRLGGVRRIYGYRRGGRGPFIQGPSPVRASGKTQPLPMQDYYLEICRWMGLEMPSNPRPRLYIGKRLREEGDRLLAELGIRSGDLLIGVVPGASFGKSKCWPADRFVRVAEEFSQVEKAKIILFSGPGEEDIIQTIRSQCRADLILPDRMNLRTLKPLIERCQLVIANDTGPRHYAVALDVPVVVLMGPTDPRYTASNLKRSVVLRKELPCSPCHLKVCPTDHRCMTEISAEEVLKAGRGLLAGMR